MTFRIFIISGVVYTFGKLEKIECGGKVVENSNIKYIISRERPDSLAPQQGAEVDVTAATLTCKLTFFIARLELG